MKDISTLEILRIIEEIREKELECAKVSDKLRKNTRNPIKRIHLKVARQRFMDHVLGIDLVLSELKRRAF